MTAVRPEFKVGLLAVSGIVLLVLGVNYLKGFNPFARTSNYLVVYDQVSGLAVSNPVLINGFQVGQVNRIEFLPQGSGELLVEFSVEHPQLYFPSNSVAQIHSSDLFGTKAIRLVFGDSESFAAAGDTLLGDVEDDIAAQVQKQLEPLQRKTSELIQGVDKIIENIQSIFEGGVTEQLPEALESVNRTVQSLERSAANLDSTIHDNRNNFTRVMSNASALSTTLNKNSDALANAIQNLSVVSDSLSKIEFAATMAKANEALTDVAKIASAVASGEGTLGQLVVNDSLYNGLVATNEELQLLMDDLQMHPWKYVQVNLIGRKPKSGFSKKDMQRIRGVVEEELDEANRGTDDK